MYHFRSTSKATYLPRQTHDKQQLSDPDHGSYKLKLASNEDCINHDQYGGNNGQHQHNLPNKCNNLPDVLPLAVKYNGQQQQQRYFSPPSSKQKAVPQSAPVISTSNLKSLFNFTKLSSQVAISDEMTKLPPSSPVEIMSPRYTSQSVFDLQNTNDLLGRDDPPPYTDEIKRELVQHLEFSQPIDQLIVPSTTPIIRPPSSVEKIIIDTSPINSCNDLHETSNPSSPTKRLSNSSEPPSYEETQQSQLKNSSYPVNTSVVSEQTPVSDPSSMKPGSESPPTVLPTRTMTTNLGLSSSISESENNTLNKTLVLRLISATSETASQTDECNDSSSSLIVSETVDTKIDHTSLEKQEATTTIIGYVSRRISPEEVDCDNLSKDLVSQLSPLDKLHSILGESSFRQSFAFCLILY